MFPKRWLIVPLLLFSGLSSAQQYLNPYSYYGIGELIPGNHVAQLGMGNTSICWFDSLSVNPANPASFANLKYTAFNFALRTKIQHLKQDSLSTYGAFPSFGYFNLAFTNGKSKMRWGSGFGLIPVSEIGFRNEYVFKTDSVERTELFEHSGGFSKFYLTNSVRLFNHLNLGFNLNYFFGNKFLYNSLSFNSESQHLGVVSEIKDNFGKLSVDFGAQYQASFGKDYSLIIGSTYSLPVELKQFERRITRTYLNLGSSIYYRDTLFKYEQDINSVTIPATFGAGVMLKKSRTLSVAADFRMEFWSDFTPAASSYTLNDLTEIKLGGEYKPVPVIGASYFNKMTYRFGTKYVKSYLNVKGEDFQRNSLCFGAGFPLPKSYSTINLGFEIGTMGTEKNNLIKENFCNIGFDIRVNDIWFSKSKID
jgi:hypothetical protein